MPHTLCWVVTDGHKGTENQARGLAEALPVPYERKRVWPRFPWSYVPPALLLPPLGATTPDSDPLVPPWPDLLISCGRRATGYSMAVRRASGGKTFTVHIQDPLVDPRHFGMVIMPAHDRMRGRAEAGNVLVTAGSLHRITPARLASEVERHAGAWPTLPRPLVAVLIGGSNRRYRLTAGITQTIVQQLTRLCRDHGAGLLVTTSRRTGAENERILRAGLAELPAHVWDGSGENPYFAYLGSADVIVVTYDSINMVSEACATGKPVYVIGLEGDSVRFRLFHEGMAAAGRTRPFTGELDIWHYQPPDDMTRAAAEVRRRLDFSVAAEERAAKQ